MRGGALTLWCIPDALSSQTDQPITGSSLNSSAVSVDVLGSIGLFLLCLDGYKQAEASGSSPPLGLIRVSLASIVLLNYGHKI